MLVRSHIFSINEVPPKWHAMQIERDTVTAVSREKCHVLEAGSAAHTGKRMP